MSTDTYQGWTNAETWGVNLILANDHGSYSIVQECADDLRAQDTPADDLPYELAEFIEGFSRTLCGVGDESEDFGIAEPSMLASQLLGAALGAVNWVEIARTWLED